MQEQKDTIVFGTEPQVLRGLARKVPGYNLVHGSQADPRACIWVPGSLDFLAIDEFMSRDMAVVSVGVKQPIILCSIYMDGTIKPENMCNELEKLMAYVVKGNHRLVIAADANAHSALWHCSDNNARGDAMEDFILSNHLDVINRGNEPTFAPKGRPDQRTIIDITLAKGVAVMDWKVDKDFKASDHNLLKYTISSDCRRRFKTRHFKKANWAYFNTLLDKHTFRVNNREIWTTDCLEEAVNGLESKIIE